MNGKIRKAVHAKYDGRCAYCGVLLTQTQMRIDHIIPKRFGGANAIENYNPACQACNGYKDANSINIFRLFLKNMFNENREYLFKSTGKMNLAVRYQAIQFQEWDGLFYYERGEK